MDDLGPTILVEGFCNELPLVAFDIGVAKDLIVNGANGYRVDCFDVVKFGSAIRDCLSGRLTATAEQKRILDAIKGGCSDDSEVVGFVESLNKSVSP